MWFIFPNATTMILSGLSLTEKFRLKLLFFSVKTITFYHVSKANFYIFKDSAFIIKYLLKA